MGVASEPGGRASCLHARSLVGRAVGVIVTLRHGRGRVSYDRAVPAYVVVGIEWHDPSALEAYRAEIVDSIAAHGGRFLASSDAVEVVEGDWAPARLVVIEFPSVADAKAWHDSEAYRPLREVRRRGATSDVVLVDGLL